MKTRSPSVAICIPTFNQSDYVAAAVESAISQFDVQAEVWVSDDASTDGTASVLDKFAANPRVFIKRHAVNKGIASNAGWVMSQPRTEFIVRLDSDDMLHPHYCKNLAFQLKSFPKAAVAHCAVREIDANGISGRVRRLARRSGFQKPDEALRVAAAGYRVAANICMFRKAALDNLPYVYEEGLKFCEDWDLYARLAASGWGNVYYSRVLANYRVWKDESGLREQRRADEISGIVHVLGSTLLQAWHQRNWSCAELDAARAQFASAQSAALGSLKSDSAEFKHLRQLLMVLSNGNSELLDRQLEQMHSKRFLAKAVNQLNVKCRDFLKAIIYH